MRALDLLLTLAALSIALIPMLALAVLIRLEGPGPVLFSQVRVGKACSRFRIFKFRTMYHDPNRHLGEVKEGGTDAKAQSRALYQTTTEGDPRITRIGRFLRKSHLDELPQLLNVLQGDMSLVGVRPDVPAQEHDYPPAVWQRRHLLRPGITGVFQVLPGIQSVRRRNAADRYWTSRVSLGLYAWVLYRTLGKVMRMNSL